MNSLTTAERIEKATSEVPLLNTEQKEALRSLDESRMSRMKASGITDVVGVIAGIKPVAFLHDGEVDSQSVAALGLNCEPMANGLYAASRDEHLSRELRDVWMAKIEDSEDPRDSERAMGKLLGYPETATEYFIERSPTVFTSEELPVIASHAIDDTTSTFFNQLILSPDHYHQEIDQYVIPLEIAVRELAPHTYEFIEKATRRERVSKKIGKFLKPLFGSKRIDPYEAGKQYID